MATDQADNDQIINLRDQEPLDDGGFREGLEPDITPSEDIPPTEDGLHESLEPEMADDDPSSLPGFQTDTEASDKDID